MSASAPESTSGPHPKTTAVTVARRYPAAPLVGVAAVVFNQQRQVLLVKRKRPPAQGQWGLPGGLLDLGESLTEGARREVREECGVEIDVGGLVDVFEPIERDAAGIVEYHYVVIDFWATHRSGDPFPSDDAAAVEWVPIDDDRRAMRPETRRVIRKAHDLWQNAQSV